MEKKQYIAPEMTIVEMESESALMSLSSPDLEETKWGNDEATGMDADARGRRGKWGNLWEE